MPQTNNSLVYFETSAWNRLADRPDRDGVIARVKELGLRVVTGLYAAGELLSTTNAGRRRALCELVTRVAHGGAPLLDHPEYLAKYAVQAWRNGEADLLARESPGARRLRFFLENPDRLDDASRREIVQWIQHGAHADHDAVLQDLAPVGPRAGPPFCSEAILRSREWNEAFAAGDPVVKENRLSLDEVEAICEARDVWKAYRAMVAFTGDAGLDRMPVSRPNPKGGRDQRRPGGPDIRQAVYLGVCGTFVLQDGWLEESLSHIAAAAGLPRLIVRAESYFEQILDT